tara:strand:- start:1306 stop:2199 length:894 start_codon:yes stop_codon:yes gene_type:complete
MKSRKGIILAGGNGSRLYPLTIGISKQLMPVYDKPMIYYPLSTLMLSGIREILIICTPRDINIFKAVLGNGEKWGITLDYVEQKKPDGIAQAILIGESFINSSPNALILGDNLFYGQSLPERLQKISNSNDGATLFSYQVSNPEAYGTVEFDQNLNIISIEEKPILPKSNNVITGLYFYDENVVDLAKSLIPSKRGELEITDLNNLYLKRKKLKLERFGRGFAWLDTGSFDSLLEASSFIRTIEKRQGLKISCPEEIAWNFGWIKDDQLEAEAHALRKSGYGNYLLKILKSNKKIHK